MRRLPAVLLLMAAGGGATVADARVPPDVLGEARNTVAARRHLDAIPRGRPPRERVASAAPAASLRSASYVRAVRRLAARMRADERAFLSYYAWQVFVRTPSGGSRRITGLER